MPRIVACSSKDPSTTPGLGAYLLIRKQVVAGRAGPAQPSLLSPLCTSLCSAWCIRERLCGRLCYGVADPPAAWHSEDGEDPDSMSR